MKVLITGGAGFIGAALANQLWRDGHYVTVIDNLSAGSTERLLPGVHFTQGDVTDKPTLWELLKGVDCVYHLAARVSVSESILYPREYNAVNVGGTVALMEAMRDTGIKRVVMASSGAIYGEQAQERVTEDLSPRPTSPYGVSKLSAEYYVLSIGQLWGIETVILRIFNAYGPGQPLPPTHPPVIPQFMQQALGGGSIIVHGGGRQIRDYVFIDDVINGLAAAGTARNVNQQIINIGSGTGVSLSQLVGTVAKVTGNKVQVLHVGSTGGGVSRLVADINQAKNLLKYQPHVFLEQGLKILMQKDPRFKK